MSVWATLGIEATRDRAQIRRAYAAKLKLTNPEDDPDGFQALRFAYERALAYAGPDRTSTVQEVKREEPPTDEALGTERRPRRRPKAEETPETSADGGEESGDQQAPKPRSHDWRPPDDPGPQEAAPRRRRWRPPNFEPPPPVRRVRTHVAPQPRPAPETDAAEAEFRARQADLHRLVSDSSAPPLARRTALDEVLVPRLMDSVDRYERCEVWLAALIANNAPRADVLIDPAVAFFHWDDNRVGPRSNVGARVLARRRDLLFVAEARRVGSRHQPAFAALTRKPRGRGLLENRLTPHLSRNVQRFLDAVRRERPGVMDSLDPVAVAWWEKHLSAPRFGPLTLWAILVLPVIFAVNWARSPTTSPPATALDYGVYYLVALALVAGAAALAVYGLAWPRRLWRRRWAASAPAWVRLGWTAGLAATVIAASVIPWSDAATLALAVVAALMAYWPVIVADPDRRPGGSYAWQVRALFSFAYLAVFWIAMMACLPLALWSQMFAPVAFAIFGFVMGEGALTAAWHRDLSAQGRRRYLIALAGGVILAATAIVAGRFDPPARPVAVALVAAAVLFHKAPASVLTGRAYSIRHYAMLVGWMGWAVVAALAPRTSESESVLLVAGGWLLTGVAITCWGAYEPGPLLSRRGPRTA